MWRCSTISCFRSFICKSSSNRRVIREPRQEKVTIGSETDEETSQILELDKCIVMDGSDKLQQRDCSKQDCEDKFCMDTRSYDRNNGQASKNANCCGMGLTSNKPGRPADDPSSNRRFWRFFLNGNGHTDRPSYRDARTHRNIPTVTVLRCDHDKKDYCISMKWRQERGERCLTR